MKYGYLIFALTFGSAAWAEPDLAEYLACTAIQNDTARLACFDAVVPVAGARSAWQVFETTSPLDDTPIVTLTLEAETGRSAFGEAIVLVARCRANVTEVYIQWHDYLSFDGGTVPDLWKTVTLRLDEGAPETGNWRISADQTVTFTPDWGGILIRRMVQSEHMVAQTTPYDGEPRVAEFQLAGLQDALPPLLSACGWDL